MRKFKEAVKDGAAGRMGSREALETDLIRARMQGEMRRISVNASLNFDYCHDSAPFSGAVLPGAARFFEGLRFFWGYGIGWMSYVKIHRFLTVPA